MQIVVGSANDRSTASSNCGKSVEIDAYDARSMLKMSKITELLVSAFALFFF